MKSIVLFAAFAGATLLAQQPPPQNGQPRPLHLIPPPGVTVPDADQRQLKTGLARLGARIEALKTN
ncbi:MAG TPA: hypothetical protein VHB50_05895, partial [Bryobacteraceae bacterium]|nr:hypothetical protein [Bryobacteraceae bacterium]